VSSWKKVLNKLQFAILLLPCAHIRKGEIGGKAESGEKNSACTEWRTWGFEGLRGSKIPLFLDHTLFLQCLRMMELVVGSFFFSALLGSLVASFITLWSRKHGKETPWKRKRV
jgi:hypothetical protein